MENLKNLIRSLENENLKSKINLFTLLTSFANYKTFNNLNRSYLSNKTIYSSEFCNKIDKANKDITIFKSIAVLNGCLSLLFFNYRKKFNRLKYFSLGFIYLGIGFYLYGNYLTLLFLKNIDQKEIMSLKYFLIYLESGDPIYNEYKTERLDSLKSLKNLDEEKLKNEESYRIHYNQNSELIKFFSKLYYGPIDVNIENKAYFCNEDSEINIYKPFERLEQMDLYKIGIKIKIKN